MWSRKVFIARAMCNCLVLQLQSAEVSGTATSSFVWSYTISVNVNEGIQDPENWTQYSLFVSALFTAYAQYNPVNLTWGLLRVCAAYPTVLRVCAVCPTVLRVCTVCPTVLRVCAACPTVLRVCAACPTPRLNWRSSSVPPGTISTIRSPPGLRRIQQ
jgi:hypothetical protein